MARPPHSRFVARIVSVLLVAVPGSVFASGAVHAAEPRPAPDRGDFVLSLPVTKKHESLRASLKGSKVFPAIVRALNASLALPYDIRIKFVECGESNAWYDVKHHEIRICYEHLEDLDAKITVAYQDTNVRRAVVLDNAAFILYHEVGHALIHAYDLPITGREEDAVDQLATYMLCEAGDGGRRAALNGAINFGIDRNHMTEQDELPFWDKHSLDEQRFYNIECWAYGSDPEGLRDLVKEDLPEERASSCTEEYQKIAKSWSELLKPHRKVAS